MIRPGYNPVIAASRGTRAKTDRLKNTIVKKDSKNIYYRNDLSLRVDSTRFSGNGLVDPSGFFEVFGTGSIADQKIINQHPKTHAAHGKKF